MGRKTNLLPGVLAFIFLSIFAASHAKNLSPCNFPQIFNFGDSNSDTGDYSLPLTYSNCSVANISSVVQDEKIKRSASDGRVILDFITEMMGRPYLPSAYFGNNSYKMGANFAVSGATIRPITGSKVLYFLNETIGFTRFKACTNHLQAKEQYISTLPRSNDFSKALYIIDLGMNDLINSMFEDISFSSAQKDIEEMMHTFAARVKDLYDEGARVFWIHNTGPLGCLSLAMQRPLWMTGDLDEIGCHKQLNDEASEFNKKLKNKIVELRSELKKAIIIYVDVYNAKYKLFRNAKNLGFADPLGKCMNGNVTCADPSKFILWDGVHYTEAANRLVALAIFNGAFSDPPLSITHACYRYVTV